MVDAVNGTKSRRGYVSARRADQAAHTRHAILLAARSLITERGYRGTTVAAIAATANVSVDTIYATIGKKPELVRALLEASISGTDEAVPAQERAYVQAIRAADTAREKIEIYADAIASIQPRMAPLYLAVRDAAHTASECAEIWREISERRGRNMREFAANLRTTGSVRPELSNAEVADIVWSMNSAEYWTLLVTERGWDAAKFRRYLADAWVRLLLVD